MNNNIAVLCKDISKKYHLYDSPKHRLKEALNPFGVKYHKDYFALADVTFDVKRGETVGIVGINGSGKSTLLKIITGVLTPSSGTVTVNGRVSALLELGTGFNPEYTGIENIYFNGTIQGYSREEIDARLEDILAFADIGDFVYQPAKVYSSGMFVRLAFAVATFVAPDILIVDEALAVGDAKFQRKCYAKFEDFRSRGTTILFVSHDINIVNHLCSRAILLHNGKLITAGQAQDVTKKYHEMLFGAQKSAVNKTYPPGCGAGAGTSLEVSPVVPQEDASAAEVDMELLNTDSLGSEPSEVKHDEAVCQFFPKEARYGDKQAEIIDMGILDGNHRKVNQLETGGKYTIFFRVLFRTDLENLTLGCRILNMRGVDVFAANTHYHKISIPLQKEGSILECRFEVRMNLGRGDFFLTFGVRSIDNEVFYDRRVDAYHFAVQAGNHMDSVCLVNLEELVSVSTIKEKA